MNRLLIKKIRDNAKLPTRSHQDDAGLDLYAAEARVVRPDDVTLIPIGVSVAIEPGYAGLIWPRSGFAVKSGIDVYAGVIDAGYRGEVQVALTTVGDSVQIVPGMRIAQLLVQPVSLPTPQLVDDLPDAERGAGGFGSTDAWPWPVDSDVSE